MKIKDENLLEIKDLNGKPIKFVKIVKYEDREYVYILTGKKTKMDVMTISAFEELDNDYIISVYGLYRGSIFDTEISMIKLIESLEKINAKTSKVYYENILKTWLNRKALSV